MRSTPHSLDSLLCLGQWKYVHGKIGSGAIKKGKKSKDSIGELYDLTSDIGETTDLATKHPEKLKEMQELFKEISVTAEAPVPNRKTTNNLRSTNSYKHTRSNKPARMSINASSS